jgi:2'-5' RNA ligase
MRLFVAIDLPEPVRAAVARSAATLRRRLDTGGDSAPIRWVDPAQLHITLWFIGHLAPDRVEQVRAALDAPFAVPPFTLRLGGFGVFPSHGAARVLWVGAAAGAPGVQALHDEVGRRLVPLGLEPEDRGFSVHVTVARGRGGRGIPRRPVLEAAPAAPDAEWEVGEITLFESRQGSGGPAYLPLLRVPLTGGR